MLKLVALIGTLGFLVVTGGAVALTLAQITGSSDIRNEPPIGLFLAVLGYSALAVICWLLLRFARQIMTQPAPLVFNKPVNQVPVYQQPTALPPTTGANTNPGLNETPGYQSIIEDETKQFANQPRNQ